MTTWLPIPGYEDLYEAGTDGDIRRLANTPGCARTRVLVPTPAPNGYLHITLCRDAQPRQFTVHRLIALTFLGDPAGRTVNHKNGNKADNRLANLEYLTAAENMQHAYATGLQPSRQGSANSQARLTEDDVWAIRMAAALAGEDIGTHTALAERYGVSRHTISRILANVIWPHVEVYP